MATEYIYIVIERALSVIGKIFFCGCGERLFRGIFELWRRYSLFFGIGEGGLFGNGIVGVIL